MGTPEDYHALWSQGLMIAPTLLHAAAEGGVRLNQRNVRPDGSYGLGPPLIDYEAFGRKT